MPSISCTVLSTSHVFLPPYIGFPNLGHCTSFLGGTCTHGKITFVESSELFLGMVGMKCGRGFVFPVLQYLGN